MITRLLGPTDEAALEQFLSRHRDSSLTLRSNVRLSGLVYRDAPFHGQYVAGFDGREMVALIAHAWNGVLLVQAPEHAAAVALAAVALSGRKVTGILGPTSHVVAVREALGLDDAALQVEQDEALFALDLANLVVPPRDDALDFRAPLPEDRRAVVEWRLAFNLELGTGNDTPEARLSAAAWFDWLVADGTARLATKGGTLVSLAAISARLPDMVETGGVYTPPALRGRHFARATIASSLLAARNKGVQRAVLSTSDAAAIRCCQSLGFAQVGELALRLFT